MVFVFAFVVAFAVVFKEMLFISVTAPIFNFCSLPNTSGFD